MISKSYIDDVIAAGPFEPTWSSLSHNPIPSWFSDAKFGIFTHWGLYSVPAYANEWYSRNMYIQGSDEYEHHRATFGEHREFGYKDFIGQFTADKFDADQWVDLFARVGARYYMPVSEHHDGFQMYGSGVSRWNSRDMGPCHDFLHSWRDACARHGLHFTTSNHRAEHWWFMGHGMEFDSDVPEGAAKRGDFYWPAQIEPDNHDLYSQPYPSEEFLEDWLLRVCEIVDAYKPELMYFDWWVQHEAFKPYMQKFAAFYYNSAHMWGYPVSICYKDDGLAWGAGIPDVERGGFAGPQPFVWQMDTSIARNSWCHTSDLDYKPASEILTTLLDVVSKNGNLLLNIGPAADGSIPEHDKHVLEAIGQWLDIHGEGIYGTRPWKLAEEGPTHSANGAFSDGKPLVYTSDDFRFTSRDGFIYVFCMNPSGSEQLCVKSFARYHDGVRAPFHGIIRNVEQLGVGDISYDQTDRGLIIHPRYLAHMEYDMPVGFKISVS